MLVGTAQISAAAQRWRKGAWLSLVVLVLCLLSLTPYLTSSTEIVRMRNALQLMDGEGHSFDWTPANVPADFMLERGAPDPLFVEAANRLGLAGMSSDWERAVAISRHLLSNPNLVGQPIQSDLRDTYRRIVENGEGYCGDFTRVFMAFAIAEGIPVRAWSFSLDGFGGHGHIWPEIWNRQRGQWELVDVFNNFYFRGQDGLAVSAVEFRRIMLEDPKSLHPVLLHTGARPGYEFEDKLRDWYLRGIDGWYMTWGNNVFSYDKAIVVRHLGRVSRSLEQLDGIAMGVYPKVILMVSETNRARVDAMWLLRTHLIVAAWVSALAMLSLFGCSISLICARRCGSTGGSL